MKPKTKIEIIQETYEYYTEDPSRRGYDSVAFSCQYLTKDGKMCAVGRCMISPSPDYIGIVMGLAKKVYNEGDFNPSHEVVADLDSVLKPEYRGHDRRFWQDIQSFHDIPLNWYTEGITTHGQNFYDDLVEEYS